MNRKLLEKLIQLDRICLTRIELGMLIGRSPKACDSIIRRAVQAGYLQRLKRGLYIATSKAGANKPDTREIAQFVYGPSYISFESALSWHNWIPEGVRVMTSASTKRGKEFITPIGTFTYEKVPCKAFTLGGRYIKTAAGSFLIADAWKALADLMFVRKSTWPDIHHIYEDLRIEEEDLINSNIELLKDLAMHYPSKRVRHYLNIYYKELKK